MDTTVRHGYASVMSTRVEVAFEPLFTLCHSLRGTARFTGLSELGRARATVGSGDGQMTAGARHLGDWANGISLDVRTRAGSGRVEFNYGGTSKSLIYTPPSGATAEDAVGAFSALQRNARSTRDAAQYGAYEFLLDIASGDGSDPPGVASVAASGGLAPSLRGSVPCFESETTHGGFFFFAMAEPLEIVQIVFDLAASAAWTVGTRKVKNAFLPDSGANLVSLGGATGAAGVVRGDGALLLPGYGVCFTADTYGDVFVTVRRPRT